MNGLFGGRRAILIKPMIFRLELEQKYSHYNLNQGISSGWPMDGRDSKLKSLCIPKLWKNTLQTHYRRVQLANWSWGRKGKTKAVMTMRPVSMTFPVLRIPWTIMLSLNSPLSWPPDSFWNNLYELKLSPMLLGLKEALFQYVH